MLIRLFTLSSISSSSPFHYLLALSRICNFMLTSDLARPRSGELHESDSRL